MGVLKLGANKNQKVDDFIEGLPEKKIQELTNHLRSILFETSDHFVEEIKWNMPSYGLGGNICYLQPSKKHVNLGFYKGAKLKDEDHLLEGTGKEMRHIRIKNVEDIQPEKVKRLIQEAIEFKG